jgi:hypothetical protein
MQEDTKIITNIIPLFPELMAENVVDQIKESITKLNQIKQELLIAQQKVIDLKTQLDQEQALFSLKSKLFQFEYETKAITDDSTNNN